MKPTQGRLVTYFRSASSETDLESFPALIITAALKSPRQDLDGKLVPWDPGDERSYTYLLHVFGRTADDKHAADFSKTPAAGCWSWPKRVEDDVPMVRDTTGAALGELGPGPTEAELAERAAGKEIQAHET